MRGSFRAPAIKKDREFFILTALPGTDYYDKIKTPQSFYLCDVLT